VIVGSPASPAPTAIQTAARGIQRLVKAGTSQKVLPGKAAEHYQPDARGAVFLPAAVALHDRLRE
jgi:hypothetical protein